MNYGCIVIPEGLLNHIATYKHLIIELNMLFKETEGDYHEMARKLFADLEYAKSRLTPWSFSLFNSLPDFTKTQLLTEREMSGAIRIN